MGAAYEWFVYTSSVAVTSLVFVISNFITAWQYAYLRYPQATLATLGVFGVYVLYRTIVRIVKSWINMILMIIRLFMLLLTICLGLVIYMRGMKFFDNDIPVIQEFLTDESNLLSDKLGSLFHKLVYNVASNQFVDYFTAEESKSKSKKKSKAKGKEFQKKAGRVLNEYGIEIDTDYLDYINEEFETGEHKAEEFVENIQDLLKDVGFNARDFLDRFNL